MLEQCPYVAISCCPACYAGEEDEPECSPSVWDGEDAEGCEAVGAVEGAEKGFGAWFYERGEGDGEFSDAEPARAAVEVGYE